MVVLDNISVSFDGVKVIENFSMNVNHGQKVVISGPSGIGKSTILNSMLGFVEIQSGSIEIDKILLSASTIKQIRAKTAWLPQDLYFKLDSAEDLLFFPFSFAQNKNHKPTENEISEMLENLQLEQNILSKKLDEISGGQKQRVALASQLLLKKTLLLLDEPTSALDDEAQNAVIKMLRLKPELTVVSVSHNNNWNKHMDMIIELKKPS